MEGWIKLYRKIVDNPYYFSEPFTRSQAWIDLLILANHKDNFYYKRGVKIDVKRGQIGMSLENLAKRFRWSRGKIERFISELESSSQIVRQNNNVTTLLSIVNYDLYQQDSNADNKPSRTQNSKANGHQTVKQTDTNKNVKNVKNVNNEKEELLFVDEKSTEIINDNFTPEQETAFTESIPIDAKPKKEKEKKSPSAFTSCIEVYNQFVLKLTGLPGKFDGQEGKAMKTIIAYLGPIANDKTDQGIINSWKHILSLHDKWEPFHRTQIKISQINSNLINIINSIKNPNNGTKQKFTSIYDQSKYGRDRTAETI